MKTHQIIVQIKIMARISGQIWKISTFSNLADLPLNRFKLLIFSWTSNSNTFKTYPILILRLYTWRVKVSDPVLKI